MKILVAPDSFKGSVSAKIAAEAMGDGVDRGLPGANVCMVPMADGGEGTTDCLLEATSGTMYEVEVHDPLGRSMTGSYGITGDGKTAVIELASASGLHTLSTPELDPRIASTEGTGELIVDALNRGLRHFIICLGGSATNDGGAGLLRALGFRFLDQSARELDQGGAFLQALTTIDTSRIHPGVSEAQFEVACDVNNPLTGPDGASAVFGPQKGASQKTVKQLDAALKVYAASIGQDIAQTPGAGAAGGTAAGLLAFLHAELKPGIKLVIEALQLEWMLKREYFDFLLTGEGKIDSQTASGKVVAGLAELAQPYGIPVIALGGAVEGDLAGLHEKGLTAAFGITEGPMLLEEAMANGRSLIEKQTEQIFRLLGGVKRAT